MRPWRRFVRRARARNDLTEYAVVGGRLFRDLIDSTADLSALDGSGQWVVILPFAGEPVCARFARVSSAPPPAGRVGIPGWPGIPLAQWRSSLDRAAFVAGVERLRREIAAGNVYQVNLTRRLRAPLPRGSDIGALGRILARYNPAPHEAVVCLPRHGVMLASASPELFLSREGSTVRSSPIKGTAAQPDGFLPKDAAENVMIVDLVRNDLGRVCEWGSVRVPGLLVRERHPGLHHLVSTVEGTLAPGRGWPELIAATFPPGSVTGAPKLAALDLIDRLEPEDRGIYCGAVGWVDADRQLADLNVAIRTFWLDDDELNFGTGGGITYDSSPEGEWEETELKARRLLTAAAGSTTLSPQGRAHDQLLRDTGTP